jgi:hypothetical protein
VKPIPTKTRHTKLQTRTISPTTSEEDSTE